MEYAWIPFAIFAGVLMVFFQILFVRTRRQRVYDRVFEESFQKPICEMDCGLILDTWSSGRGDFVRFSIYSGFVVIAYNDKILLRAEDLDSLEPKKFFLNEGLQIHHHKVGVSKKIILVGGRNPEYLKADIEKALSLGKKNATS